MARLVALVPGVTDRLAELEASLWHPDRLDPALTALVRSRVAALLGDRALPPAGPEPADPSRADARACLDFAELYVIDPHAVTDEVCAAVVAHLGEAGATALTMAVATFDALSRSRVALATTLAQED